MFWGPEADELGHRPRLRRVWSLSPAVATLLFLVLQAMFSVQTSNQEEGQVAAAAAEGPAAVVVSVRVVHALHRVEDRARVLTPVPDDEETLLRLLENDPAVVFSASEVEPLETAAKQFTASEVGVITIDGKLRRATLAK